MAYAKRLTIVGSNIAGQNADIEVYLEGFTGTAVTRESSGEPISIEWGAQDGDLLPLVYGSAATIKFIAEDDFEFLDLFATTARDIYVKILIDSVVFWEGFAEPGKWSEPLISPKYEVSLTAYDGLGLLKDEDFKTTDKEYYEGTATPLYIAQTILAKTGLSLPLNIAADVRPVLMDLFANPLTLVLINMATYRDLNCYEVLEQLFVNCRIQQRGGEWWIISNTQLNKSSISCYHYLANGTAAGTSTFSPEITDFWYEDTANMELISPIKQITVKQTFGYQSNVVTNQNFEDVDGSGDFEAWYKYGGITTKQYTYDDGNKYVALFGREKFGEEWTHERYKYMVSEPIPVSASVDIPVFSIDFAVMGEPGRSATVLVGIGITTPTSHYSAITELDADRKTVLYKWDEREEIQPLPCSPKVTHIKHFLSADSYFIEPEPIPAFGPDEITDNFHSTSMPFKQGVPAAGLLRIYLYVPNTAQDSIDAACFRKVSLRFTGENEEDLATGKEIIIVNSLRNNNVPEDLELLNGDIPNIPNATTIYQNGFIKNDGTGATTTLWTIDGTAYQYPWAEMMGRLMVDQVRNAKQAIKARLGDTAPNALITFEDPDNAGKMFVEAGIKYDFLMNTVEGRFIEINAPDPSGFSLYETIDTTQPAASSQRPAASGGIYADEKVGMITPLFEIVNQPGYLSTDDFVQEIDELSGKAKIGLRAPIPAGGTTGQALKKVSDDDYDYAWADDETGTGEENVQSDWNQTDNTADDYIKNKPTIPSVNSNYLKDWIEFEFADFTAGTAKDYVLDLKALVAYTIDSAVMQVDTGTLTVAIKIGTTAVTSLSAVAVDTDIDETAATGANSVSAGNKVILAVSTTYTGSPTLIRGKLNLTRT